jgi:DNA-binding response OmpR family regulator
MARILVMESNDLLREVVNKALTEEGDDVCPVAQPTVAIDLLGERPFDLVVTGLVAHTYAPEVWEPVEALREAARATPVVLMADFPEVAQLDPAAYGLTAILVQPFDLDHLLAEVNAALDR